MELYHGRKDSPSLYPAQSQDNGFDGWLMLGEPLFREVILRQLRGVMSSMMYQKADNCLIAEDISKTLS